MSRDVLDAVPSAHTIQSLGQLVTGVTFTAPDVGGSQAMQQTYFTVHGLGAAQTSLLVDGMIINGLQGDGAIQTYFNEGTNQEMVYQTGGGNVDSPTGGVKINMVPKEGGNRFSGSLFEGYESQERFRASNCNDFLYSHGVTSVDKIGTYNDTDLTLGGPIRERQALGVRIGAAVHRQQADRQHRRVRRDDGRRAACYAGAEAVRSGCGLTASVQCARPPDVADEPAQQAVGLHRSHPQGPRGRHESRRRPDDRVGPLEFTALHDQHASSGHKRRRSKLLIEARVLEQHRALQQPVCRGHRASRTGSAGLARGRAARTTRHSAASGSPPTSRPVSIRTATTPRVPRRTSPAHRASRSGFQDSWGVFNHVNRGNAALYQNYQTRTGV